MREISGFTLIELLVTITIIGVLASIAIPQFAEYRKRSFDATSQSDLRNAALAEEAYAVENEGYAACADKQDCETILPGFKGSKDVEISMSLFNPDHFSGIAFHPRGSRNSAESAYRWDSLEGGLQ